MIKRTKQWFKLLLWKRFVATFFGRHIPTLVKHVANRSIYISEDDRYEYTLVLRDKNQPDGYSREEVMEMLSEVRQAEKRMGWSCPEPVSIDEVIGCVKDLTGGATLREHMDRLRGDA